MWSDAERGMNARTDASYDEAQTRYEHEQMAGRSSHPRPARRFIAVNQLSRSTSPDSTVNAGSVLTR